MTQEAAERADIDRIRLLEDLGADAWPAATTIRQGGWRLGLDRGVTRRANSVLPNAPVADPEALIDLVERRYRGHGLRPCFKMTVAALPADLDRRLESRGYRAEGHSLVLVADAGELAPPSTPRIGVTLHDRPTAAWLDTCWPPGERAGERAALEQIAARVPPPCAFGLARLDGIDAGAALAVAGRGWVGLTAVHTLPAQRRRGVAPKPAPRPHGLGARAGCPQPLSSGRGGQQRRAQALCRPRFPRSLPLPLSSPGRMTGNSGSGRAPVRGRLPGARGSSPADRGPPGGSSRGSRARSQTGCADPPRAGSGAGNSSAP